MSGVLHARQVDAQFHHARLLPAPELRPFVDCYWSVHWDLRKAAPRRAETLPHPCVLWVTERGRSAIWGINTRRFSRRLHGRGRVCGVRFHPGGFHPFLGAPVSSLTDGCISLRRAFGAAGTVMGSRLRALDAAALNGTIAARGEDSADEVTDEQMMDLLDEFLLARLPPPDPRLSQIADMVRAIKSEAEITRVAQVAERYGMTARSLQRLFDVYVGVSPKWVIQRYRIHEALDRVDAGRSVDWARLAIELGYYDQTHFIKEFKALTGRSPGQYEKGPGSAEAV